MDFDEIVGKLVERYRRNMIRQFAREGVGEPRISPKAHADAQILSLSKASADVLWIRASVDCLRFAADTLCGAVPGFPGPL